jgi:hypothetical protein
LDQNEKKDSVLTTSVDETVCESKKLSKTLGAIWKYTLEHAEVQEVGLPSGAQIISACGKNGQVVIYAIGDKDNLDTDTYKFYVYGTSEEFDMEEVTPDMFLGTVSLGTSVVHVFVEQVETQPIDDPDLQ